MLLFGVGIVLGTIASEQCSRCSSERLSEGIFQQILKDLRPFKRRGISKDMVDRAYCADTPGFRVQILNGSLYFAGETYSYETRALSVKMMLYTLIARSKVPLPDVDFMLSLGDFPPPETRMKKKLAPIFAPCRTKHHKAVLYPDHTFWNWMEASTEGWESSLQHILRAAETWEWEAKIGKAFFAGASTSPSREALAEQADNPLLDVRIFKPKDKFQKEDDTKQKKFTALKDHCQYKYLLHMPGVTYAARLKYLLLCNSTVLAPMLSKSGQGAAKPGGWFEFFYPALQEGVHYVDGVAKESDYAAVVGSLHADQARARKIAAQGLAWAEENLSMHNIWCYWEQLLTEYSKLQKFQVTLHPAAVSFEDSLCGAFACKNSV